MQQRPDSAPSCFCPPGICARSLKTPTSSSRSLGGHSGVIARGDLKPRNDIPPGKPRRNGYVESFDSCIRDECPLLLSTLLVPGTRPRCRHRLDTTTSTSPRTLIAGPPTASPLRCHLYRTHE